MLISLEHEFVFLCNRKCASTSIEHMLRAHADVRVGGPPELRHTDYRAYRKHVAPWLAETAGRRHLETICVVREPVSWLYSWFRFRSRLALRNPVHPDHARSTAGMSFEEFLSAYMDPHPPPFAQVGCQFDFVRDDDGAVGVDRIFRYEELAVLVDYLGARVGRKLRIARRNASPKQNRDLYVAAVLDRLAKAAAGLFGKGTAAASPSPAVSPAQRAELSRFIGADFALWERSGAGTAARCVPAGS